MGKNLKGKEIGKGICQRKDGLYVARFVNRYGKRCEKSFPALPLARNWLEEARYADKHSEAFLPSNTTVDEWFDFWITKIVGDLAPNTIRNYRERYIRNMKPIIGHLRLTDVKQLHCKLVVNSMYDTYKGSTILQTYTTMGAMFKSARLNDMIAKHPMDGLKVNIPISDPSNIRALTVEEQEKFLEVAKRSHNYYQYALLLETGLRTGELIGLTWDAIDWKKRTLTVNKTLEFRHKQGSWRAGPPKTPQSYRTIPLTKRAYSILEIVHSKIGERKESEMLSQTLDYMDRYTGQKSTLVMRDLVFINYRTGAPAKNSSYDTHLYKLCDEAGIKHFSMHVLRHTYATRAIESGMQPKALQKLLGHASIQTTMDKYVHVTDDSMANAIKQFEGANSSEIDEIWEDAFT